MQHRVSFECVFIYSFINTLKILNPGAQAAVDADHGWGWAGVWFREASR